jgi:hypothetical protein
MDNFIIAYIAHRMAELGFKKYGFEPMLIITSYGGPSEYVIEAQNEYYYLASAVVAQGTEILADNHYFKAENFDVPVNYAYVQEFTGQIKITFPPSAIMSLEFIRVIPQVTP